MTVVVVTDVVDVVVMTVVVGVRAVVEVLPVGEFADGVELQAVTSMRGGGDPHGDEEPCPSRRPGRPTVHGDVLASGAQES